MSSGVLPDGGFNLSGVMPSEVLSVYQRKYVTNEDDNIIRVSSMNIILLIFMTDPSFMYIFNEGCFTFISHDIASFIS